MFLLLSVGLRRQCPGQQGIHQKGRGDCVCKRCPGAAAGRFHLILGLQLALELGVAALAPQKRGSARAIVTRAPCRAALCVSSGHPRLSAAPSTARGPGGRRGIAAGMAPPRRRPRAAGGFRSGARAAGRGREAAGGAAIGRGHGGAPGVPPPGAAGESGPGPRPCGAHQHGHAPPPRRHAPAASRRRTIAPARCPPARRPAGRAVPSVPRGAHARCGAQGLLIPLWSGRGVIFNWRRRREP